VRHEHSEQLHRLRYPSSGRPASGGSKAQGTWRADSLLLVADTVTVTGSIGGWAL
jgi:hypothetical protein